MIQVLMTSLISITDTSLIRHDTSIKDITLINIHMETNYNILSHHHCCTGDADARCDSLDIALHSSRSVHSFDASASDSTPANLQASDKFLRHRFLSLATDR